MTKQYFTKVVEEEKELLFRLAFAILNNIDDAEDAVSEAIMIAWKERIKLRDKKKLRNWLIQISLNAAKKIYRNNRKEIPIEQVLDKNAAVAVTDEYDIWDDVMRLPEKYRIAIILYYYRELSIKEISETLHIPEGTVKTRLSRAKEKLRVMCASNRY